MAKVTVILPLFALIYSVHTLAVDKLANAISIEASKGLSFTYSQGQQGLDTKDHLSVVAVGDVLLHKPLHVQGLNSSIGHISLWKNLEGLILSADMAYANLEGPVAPGISRSRNVVHDPGRVFDNNVYTSYPMFNYHEELVEDLVKSGFDVVSTANNHALDRGSLGVDKTIEILNKNHLPYTGTQARQDSSDNSKGWYSVVEKNGFRVAWLACTFSTNGIPDRYDQVLDCFGQSSFILSTIKELAQNRSIDAIMITPHVGFEYEDTPRRDAINLYHSFIEAGALAVFGSHPHVLQPWEKYTATDDHQGLIIYSLGNFVSGQFQKVKTRATIMLTLDLVRDAKGKTVISQVQYLPLEMTNSGGVYTVKAISSNSGSRAIYDHILDMFGTMNLLSLPNLKTQASSIGQIP